MIPAIKKDQDLIREIEASYNIDETLRLWWLGQSGYLVQYKSIRILIDPYLSDSLTIKYKDTDKPHTRISELVCDPALFTKIDLITSSHNHTDHLDAETIHAVLKNNLDVKMVIPEANRNFVADRLHTDPSWPYGLNDGKTLQINDSIKVHGITAKHNEISRDEAGNCHYMGYVFEVGPYKIYHSGDTLWHDDMIEQVLCHAPIDIALLPINGNLPERRVAGNLDAQEAAFLGQSIKARCTIPCHYDLFEFNTADVSQFEKYAQIFRIGYRVLRLGEGYGIGMPLIAK